MEIEKAVSLVSVDAFWDSSRLDMSLDEACRIIGRETGIVFGAPPELHQWEAVLDAVFPQLGSHGILLRALIVLTPSGADPMVVSALSGIRPVPLFL